MLVTEQHRTRIQTGCDQLGLTIDAQALKKIGDYLENLAKWNKAYNLTAVRDPDEMVIKHLLDSLTIVPFVHGKQILDVGTGPGLPGIPVALCDTNRHWTLIDSNGKKTRFLIQMKAELQLTNVDVIKGRIEALPQKPHYDVITSRAFSSLSNFVGVCLPLLKEGGQLLAMKGLVPESEIEQLDQSLLSIETIALDVPFLHEERHLIVVTKNTKG